MVSIQNTLVVLSTFFLAGAAAKWRTARYPVDGCSTNEKRVACDYNCEPQCGFSPVRKRRTHVPNVMSFQNICSFECRRNVCVCRNGYVRNTKNECVHRLECTAETSRCPEDEEFQVCGSPCQPSCEDPHPTYCPSDRCVRNVCRCKPGFVRNGDVCTTLAECRIYPSRPLELFTV